MHRFLFICLLLSSFAELTAGEKRPRVRFETTMGPIVVELYNETPLHRDNFLQLIARHAYDSLLFHRVVANFMIQAGDPESRRARPGQKLGEGTLDYTLAPEFRTAEGLYHRRGALCAAREGDDANPDRRSDAIQFYIVWGTTYTEGRLEKARAHVESMLGRPYTFSPEQTEDYLWTGGTPALDEQYTVFGQVVEGLDTVEDIQAQPRDAFDRPVEDIRILRAVVEP